jgi:hypothetical protein
MQKTAFALDKYMVRCCTGGFDAFRSKQNALAFGMQCLFFFVEESVHPFGLDRPYQLSRLDLR